MQESNNPASRINSIKKTIAIAFLIVAISVSTICVHECINKNNFSQKYKEYIEKYSAQFGVPESVIYAVMKVESDFDKNAISSSNPPAKGLMQITDETFMWIGNHLLKENANLFMIFDPETNIKYGTYLLSYLYGRFNNWDTVYAAYNAGLSRVNSWLKDPSYSDSNGNLTYIPFGETRAYVKKVAEFRIKYEEQNNNK